MRSWFWGSVKCKDALEPLRGGCSVIEIISAFMFWFCVARFHGKQWKKKNVRMRTSTFCRDHVHPTESSGNGMSLCTECPSCRKLLSSCPWFWWVVSVLILSLPSSTEGWRVQSILIKVSLKRFSIEVSPNTHSFLTFFYYQPLYDNVMNNRWQSNAVINSRIQSQSELQHEIISLLISHTQTMPVEPLQNCCHAAPCPAPALRLLLCHVGGPAKMENLPKFTKKTSPAVSDQNTACNHVFFWIRTEVLMKNKTSEVEKRYSCVFSFVFKFLILSTWRCRTFWNDGLCHDSSALN